MISIPPSFIRVHTRRAAYVFLGAGLLVFPLIALSFSVEHVSFPDGTNDFLLSPAKVEVSVAPGETATQSISVSNRTPGPLSFTVSVEDIKGTREKETDIRLLGDEKGPYSLRDVASPEIAGFTLESGERIVFDVSISPPRGFEGGGLYGAIVVASTAEKGVGSGARVVSRLASLFLVRVSGTAVEQGRVLDFRVGGPARMFYDREPLSLEVLYENEGTVHLVPYGVIEITNIFGSVVETIPIDPYFALPESTRFRELVWDASGSLGWYEATLRINRGYDDIVDERTITVVVFPWTVALGVLTVLVALVFGVRHVRLRRLREEKL